MGNASDEENEDDDFGDECVSQSWSILHQALLIVYINRYSDDDDTSWKVRRAATKLLSACISTRPDLLTSFYRTISPALIARFSEREETVKVEVWATYTALLAQTKILGSTSGASEREDSPSGSLKRKRSSDAMIVEDGCVFPFIISIRFKS